MTLNTVPKHQLATIVDVTNKRLVSLGFTVGSKIQVLRTNSNVIHCRVGTTEFAIRKDIAKEVKLRW